MISHLICFKYLDHIYAYPYAFLCHVHSGWSVVGWIWGFDIETAQPNSQSDTRWQTPPDDRLFRHTTFIRREKDGSTCYSLSINYCTNFWLSHCRWDVLANKDNIFDICTLPEDMYLVCILMTFMFKCFQQKLMHFPTWIDLKGQDSVPETVHHVVCSKLSLLNRTHVLHTLAQNQYSLKQILQR